VSCSWPTALTTGTGHAAIARTSRSSLNGSRSSKLPPPRAITTTSTPSRHRAPSASTTRPRARALHVGLGDEHVRRREAGRDDGQDVALRGGVVAGHEPDPPRQERQRPLALGGEQPLRGELLLQPLERREVVAEAEALERERAQPELARASKSSGRRRRGRGRRREVEPQRVELPARHRDAEARAVLGSLSVKKTLAQRVRAPQLRDLALDPDRRQPASQEATPRLKRPTE
jgi:hypothetical protein